jgi:hypothetical protein
MMRICGIQTGRCGRVAILSLLGAASVALAADPAVKLPGPGSQWKMEIDAKRREKKAESAEDGPVRPVQLQVSMDANGVEERVLSFSDGSRQTAYSLNGMVYQAIPGTQEVLALAGSGLHAPDPGEWRVAGFPGTAWIQKKYLVGREELNGIPCSRYHRPAVVEEGGIFEPELNAWIREPERVPVRVQVGTSVYDFSPVTRFTGSVSVPPAVLKKVQALERQNAALRRLSEREKNGGR